MRLITSGSKTSNYDRPTNRPNTQLLFDSKPWIADALDAPSARTPCAPPASAWASCASATCKISRTASANFNLAPFYVRFVISTTLMYQQLYLSSWLHPPSNKGKSSQLNLNSWFLKDRLQLREELTTLPELLNPSSLKLRKSSQLYLNSWFHPPSNWGKSSQLYLNSWFHLPSNKGIRDCNLTWTPDS